MGGDRSWMHIEGINGRRQDVYRDGVEGFLDFAFKDVVPNSRVKLLCPCRLCQNRYSHTREVMKVHLIKDGIEPFYNPWIHHGEDFIDPSDDINYEEDYSDFEEEDSLVFEEILDMVHEAMNVPLEGGEEFDSFPENFKRLMKEAKEDLYPGCKSFKKLEFIVFLLHLKVTGCWNDKSFTLLLSALQKAFNYDPGFPKSSNEAKKYTRDLGLNYLKIHGCTNHCILYRKEYTDLSSCPTCGEPRWQENVVDVDDSGNFMESQGAPQKSSKIHRLVLRYFPLASRLQRFFMSTKLATHMRWHTVKREKDGVLRHPADSKAWQKFEEIDPEFAKEPRNVRLGLAADGFVPNAHTGTSHSIWIRVVARLTYYKS